MNTLDNKRHVALHEAGHVLACLATRSTFTGATIRAHDHGNSAGRTYTTNAVDPHRAAIVTAAGGIAQQYATQDGDTTTLIKALYSSPEEFFALGAGRSMRADLAELLQLAGKHKIDFGKVLISTVVTIAVLNPLLPVVADALTEPKPLRFVTEREIRNVLDAAGTDPWVEANHRLGETLLNDEVPVDPWLTRYVRDRLDRAQYLAELDLRPA